MLKPKTDNKRIAKSNKIICVDLPLHILTTTPKTSKNRMSVRFQHRLSESISTSEYSNYNYSPDWRPPFLFYYQSINIKDKILKQDYS